MRNALAIHCLIILWMRPAFGCDIDFAYSTEPAPPFQMGVGEAAPARPGAGVELVREVAEKIGCTAHFIRLPNIRVLTETQGGRHDAAFMYSYNPEREAGGLVYPLRDGKPDHDRRMTTQHYFLYRLKGSAIDWDGQHISHLDAPIGVNTGWSIGRDLRARGIAVEEVPNARQNLDKLHAGRIAAYATEDEPAQAAMRIGIDDNVEAIPTPLTSKDNFVMFSRAFYAQHADIAERFWRELALRRDEALARLLPSYR
jgi:polar amino acid transport system substrate-binding protein